MRTRRNSTWRMMSVELALLLATLLFAAVLLAAGCGADTPAATAERPSAAPTATTLPAPQSEATAAETAAEQRPTATPAETPIEPAEAQPAAPAEAPTEAEQPVLVEADVQFVRPASPTGRTAPVVASTPAELAAQIEAAERGLADSAASSEQLADWGHLHQVAIRKIGYEPDWDIEFFEALPSDLQARTLLHVSARRALVDLSSGFDAADFIPAWEIVEPEPAENLVQYYQSAEAATGIEWEYLAAINLVETGMGRIRGLSSAGAQGPMQFLPTTWAESGIGAGDINDPSDAIAAAARYLVRRGGPADMPGAIWGYNNSDAYVTAVSAYAEMLRRDPNAYQAIYNWEIYFYTEAGDVWLPVGFRSDESVDLVDYLAAHPWSVPDPGLR